MPPIGMHTAVCVLREKQITKYYKEQLIFISLQCFTQNNLAKGKYSPHIYRHCLNSQMMGNILFMTPCNAINPLQVILLSNLGDIICVNISSTKAIRCISCNMVACLIYISLLSSELVMAMQVDDSNKLHQKISRCAHHIIPQNVGNRQIWPSC